MGFCDQDESKDRREKRSEARAAGVSAERSRVRTKLGDQKGGSGPRVRAEGLPRGRGRRWSQSGRWSPKEPGSSGACEGALGSPTYMKTW